MTQVRAAAQKKMEMAYPDNNTMCANIGKLLQQLRGDGIIVFVEGRRGSYRWTETHPSDSEEEMEPWPDMAGGEEIDECNETVKVLSLTCMDLTAECESQRKQLEEQQDKLANTLADMAKLKKYAGEVLEQNKALHAAYKQQCEQLKNKNQHEREIGIMISKAKKVAREALEITQSKDSTGEESRVDWGCGKVEVLEEEPCLNRTWSNEAVCDGETKLEKKGVKFEDKVERKMYEIDGLMRPHKNWANPPFFMSTNMPRC